MNPLLMWLQPRWPGFLVCAVVAIAAKFVSEHYGAPVMLMALLLGMALNFLSVEGTCKPGIEVTARQVLRIGVALLGLRITLDQVTALGWQPVLMVVGAVAFTIGLGVVLARWMGYRVFFGLLTGGAVGICGASAALALSAALPNHPLKEKATLFTVIGVSTLSTLAMVLYPLFTHGLGLTDAQAGFFIGATIHDVAQVVGAGYSISREAGDLATLVKLIRVAMLLPVIALVAWITARHMASEGDGQTPTQKPPLLPGFAVAFAVLMLVNSTGGLPQTVVQAGQTTSQWCLMAAMVAIGMKTHLKDMLNVGWKPIALMVIETLALAGFVYGLIRL
ncbi:MAG: putative sulfate exporter family transporter [Limnohabitans sp.]|uniref:YeiH family protein n=1 Tax=Limnohabitans sp. TaxID=1907725 RepID=UPI003BAF39A7